jgi:hypothetical protein
MGFNTLPPPALGQMREKVSRTVDPAGVFVGDDGD